MKNIKNWKNIEKQ